MKRRPPPEPTMQIDPEDFRSCPIPPQFQSLELDGPFQHCLTCDAALMELESPYLIERIFRGDEPIIEYAMCSACHDQLSGEISQESTQRINDYFSDQWDLERMFRRALSLADWDESQGVQPWLDECILTGEAFEDCRERQIYGYCVRDRLLLGGGGLSVFPMMISGAAIEALSQRLSEATRGWMDDFVGDHFGLSPDFADSPDWMPVVM